MRDTTCPGTISGTKSDKAPPRQYIPDRNYDTQHIKLELSFNWERKQTIGTATITFTPLTTNLQTAVASALGNLQDAQARNALLAAAKDKDARVHTSAITALAKSKDPQLVSVYLSLP